MTLRNLIYQSIIWRGLYFLSVLVLNIMIARYYEASDSGVIYFIVNSFALVVIAGSLSLESGTSFFLASHKNGPEELSYFSLLWAIAATIVIAVVFRLLIKLEILPVLYKQYYIPAVLYTGGCILSNFFLSLFYAKKSIIIPNLLMIIVNFLLIALIPFTESFIPRRLYIDFYFGGFFLQGILIALAFFAVYGSNKKMILPDRSSVSGIFKYAFQALGANLLFFLLYRIDYWFVEKYCTPADLGNYIQVSKLVQIFLVIPLMVASAVFPVAAHGSTIELKQNLIQVSRVLTTSCLLGCILLAALGYWLFPLIYGHSFRNMYIPFLLLIPGIFSLSIISVLSAYFAGQNKVWINLLGALLGLLFIIVLDIIFIPVYGIAAAALISSMGYIINMLFSMRYFQQGQDISIAGFFKFNYGDWLKIKNDMAGKLLKQKN
ncbi:MAG: polysaccharide biosynthesis C-terminal domain-containing protein [Bacteroidetes bacterium]|nr:polysaccharide biosynthesis C-terminal domain-containing protein [Bacteroidota bacterium]